MKHKIAQAVSIVIPVYNDAEHLRRCLQSIQKQIVLPKEVIVVDNNCTDDSVSVAKEYSFVRVVEEPKQGIVYARNRGFDSVKSDIIARIDADTRLPANWVERVDRFYKNDINQDRLLTGGGYFYNVAFKKFNAWVYGQIAYRMNRLLMGHYITWGANMALPKKVWQEIRDEVCLRNDIHEDLDLAIHAHRNGYQISYHETLRAGVKMRRVFNNFKALWPNLMLWPRTLRVHGLKTWVIGFMGAAVLWSLAFIPWSAELIRRLYRRVS